MSPAVTSRGASLGWHWLQVPSLHSGRVFCIGSTFSRITRPIRSDPRGHGSQGTPLLSTRDRSEEVRGSAVCGWLDLGLASNIRQATPRDPIAYRPGVDAA